MNAQHVSMTLSLAPLVVCSAACSSADDEADMAAEHDVVSVEEDDDRTVCREAVAELAELGCPGGYVPMARLGTPVTVTDIEEVGLPICGGRGYFLDGEDVEEPDWVGIDIVQNSHCTVGCFASYFCRGHANGCFVSDDSGNLCRFSCGVRTDEESCRESTMECSAIDPDAVEAEEC